MIKTTTAGTVGTVWTVYPKEALFETVRVSYETVSGVLRCLEYDDSAIKELIRRDVSLVGCLGKEVPD